MTRDKNKKQKVNYSIYQVLQALDGVDNELKTLHQKINHVRHMLHSIPVKSDKVVDEDLVAYDLKKIRQLVFRPVVPGDIRPVYNSYAEWKHSLLENDNPKRFVKLVNDMCAHKYTIDGVMQVIMEQFETDWGKKIKR